MTTETNTYREGPATKAVDRNPQSKGGTVDNGLSSTEPMYQRRDKYIVRHETPTDTAVGPYPYD